MLHLADDGFDYQFFLLMQYENIHGSENDALPCCFGPKRLRKKRKVAIFLTPGSRFFLSLNWLAIDNRRKLFFAIASAVNNIFKGKSEGLEC